MDTMRLLSAATLLVSCCQALSPHMLSSGGQIKAVLVAGSNGYYNYRHQADLCHAYQLLHKNGIPDENIIVMMYDDIANNTENPTPGVIINRPGGQNVYQGVPKDYTGDEVSKKNLFNVLNGDKEAMRGIGSGRVLESGPDDHVFINFVDHGGPGVLCMPNEEITASEVIKVLEDMAKNKRFSKMFFYVEACESGSIFDNLLPDNLNIFVMTAADPQESSYACFYNETYQTYLGDVFSVNWLRNSEMVNLQDEEVNHQFQDVRHVTNTSHVEEYGDIDLGITKMSEVIGYSKVPSEKYTFSVNDAVASHHVPVAVLGQQIARAKSKSEKQTLTKKLHSMLEGREKIKEFFMSFMRSAFTEIKNPKIHFQDILLKRPSLTKNTVGCFDKVVNYVTKNCFSISQNPYVTSHLHKIINVCNEVTEELLLEKLMPICKETPTFTGIV